MEQESQFNSEQTSAQTSEQITADTPRLSLLGTIIIFVCLINLIVFAIAWTGKINDPKVAGLCLLISVFSLFSILAPISFTKLQNILYSRGFRSTMRYTDALGSGGGAGHTSWSSGGDCGFGDGGGCGDG